MQPGDLVLTWSGMLYEAKRLDDIATMDESRHKFICIDLENIIPIVVSMYDSMTEDDYTNRESQGVIDAQPDLNNSLYSIQTSKVRVANIVTSQRSWIDSKGKSRTTTYGYGVQNISLFLNGGDIGSPAIVEVFSGKEGRIQANSDAFKSLSRQLAVLVALQQAYQANYNKLSLGAQMARSFKFMSTEPISNPFSKFYVNLPTDAYEFDQVTKLVNIVATIGGQGVSRRTQQPSLMSSQLVVDSSFKDTPKLAARDEAIYSSGYTGSGAGNSQSYSVSYSPSSGFTYSGAAGPGYGGMPSSLSGSTSW